LYGWPQRALPWSRPVDTRKRFFCSVVPVEVGAVEMNRKVPGVWAELGTFGLRSIANPLLG
jgi:hypothetical protein